MSEFDQLYREVILDHYKNPRGHGELEDADAHAEGQNPLCGDEVSIFVAFGEDGDTIDEVKPTNATDCLRDSFSGAGGMARW